MSVGVIGLCFEVEISLKVNVALSITRYIKNFECLKVKVAHISL